MLLLLMIIIFIMVYYPYIPVLVILSGYPTINNTTIKFNGWTAGPNTTGSTNVCYGVGIYPSPSGAEPYPLPSGLGLIAQVIISGLG